MARIERIKVRGIALRAAVESLGYDPDNATKTQVSKAQKIAARVRAAEEVRVPIASGLDYPNVR